MATLTAANSALSLIVRGFFPIPQAIQGYATDDAFATDDVNNAEVQMGVDGNLSAGFVPTPTVLNITLQADSPSIAMFDAVLAAQKAQKELMVWDGVMIIPGTGNKYAFTKGYMTSNSPTDTAKKILQPRKFQITYQDLSKAPI